LFFCCFHADNFITHLLNLTVSIALVYLQCHKVLKTPHGLLLKDRTAIVFLAVVTCGMSSTCPSVCVCVAVSVGGLLSISALCVVCLARVRLCVCACGSECRWSVVNQCTVGSAFTHATTGSQRSHTTTRRPTDACPGHQLSQAHVRTLGLGCVRLHVCVWISHYPTLTYAQ